MSNVEVSKKVFFVGVWRSQTVNDQLLQQISSQTVKKKRKQLKGSQAVLNVSSERLEIIVFDEKGKVTRTDLVPLEDIVELAANKHAATCLLAVVNDNANKQCYIFTFLCSSDKETGEILQGYRKVKQRLSGEGYNTDIKPSGINWTLQEKQEVRIAEPTNGHVNVAHTKSAPNGDANSTPNGDVRVISTEITEGQTRIMTDHTTVTSPILQDQGSVSEPELREELHNLADEIRDIKFFLHKSKGRLNFEKHYGNLYQFEEQESTPETKRVVTSVHRQEPVQETKHLTATVRRQEPVHEVRQIISTTTNIREQAPERYVKVEQKPIENEVRYRKAHSNIVHAVPQIKHFRSSRSTTSSVHSGYSKRTYDSENPFVEYNRFYVHQRPRVVSKRYIQKIQQAQPRHVTSEHFIRYPSDKVQRNIEDVYGRRSYRMSVGPVARHSAEYVEVSSPPQTPSIVVHPVEDKVKQYVEAKSVLSETKSAAYEPEPEIRHVYENTDYNDEIAPEKVIIVNQPVEHIEAQRSVVYENTRGTYDGNDNMDVIVVKANTDVYNSAREENAQSVTRESYPAIYNNTVYHIKAEGVESMEKGEHALGYKLEEIGTQETSEIIRGEEVAQDGLWESYVERPSGEADGESIDRVVAYRYHENEDEGFEKADEIDAVEEKEVKRVHYMEELEHTINDHEENDDDVAIKRELDVITRQDDDYNEKHSDGEEEQEESYVLDEEELAKFSREPNLIVIDKEEDLNY